MRAAVFIATLCLSGLLGFAVMRSPDRGAFDFQAFYCAGAAVRMHADPYRTQPLGSCEHARTDRTYAALPADVVLPAPLPGYDIAGFAVLSLLPFDLAKAVWGALLAIALTLAVFAVAGATRVAFLTAFMALGACLIFPSLAFGEIFALFAAGAFGAMYFAANGYWNAAGWAAAASLVEPHLGLPVFLSLAVWAPRSRRSLALGAGILAAVALVTLGIGQNAEYVLTVLPLHALAEVTSDAQMSPSAVLYALGVPARAAIIVGSAAYALAVITAVALAAVLADRSRQRAFLVAVPAAAALYGSSFMHVTEFFAAIPLALLLVFRRERFAAIALVALALLSVPWYLALERGPVAAFAMLGAIVIFVMLWRCARRAMIAAACAVLAFALLFFAPAYATVSSSHGKPMETIAGASYPQAGWQRFVRRELSSGSAASWLLRTLSWTGLLLLGAGAVLCVRDPHGLPVYELADAEVGEFSAVPAALDPSER